MILIIFEFYSSLLAKDTNKLKEFLHAKIAKRQKQIHPAHNIRFNHDLQQKFFFPYLPTFTFGLIFFYPFDLLEKIVFPSFG
jgi:hypothetical protein